ncbi:MAG: hypothetical protein MUO76_15055 [Anaerolineaceae bacterium]|nr:hypothetical protein [Anaerolineaceae bacterium]
MNLVIHAAIAEKRRRQQEEEEERMTSYSSDELSGEWEFKIVRSGSGAFQKPDVFQQLLNEESIAGWQLLEKLDNSRVRFKRPKSARKRDNMLPQRVDPYRTQMGADTRRALFIILGVGLAAMLIAGVVAFYFAI